MLTRDDLIDILLAGLAPAKPAVNVSARPNGFNGINGNNVRTVKTVGPGTIVPNGPHGRPFLTEWDIKKRLTPGSTRLTLPGNSIVSPLALEWLALRGIEIVKE